MVILLALVLAVPAALQGGPIRIETAEALSQVLKKVDPEVPAEAVAAKIGGAVIADVVIGPTGAVSSITIVGGHEMLHGPAVVALKQWRFRPFVRKGKPVSVRVILEVGFPDPVRDTERRAFDEHRAAERRCEQALDKEPTAAPQLCAEVVRLSDGLPKDRVLERSHAFVLHANSLARVDRLLEAIGELKRAVALRETVAGQADADTADGYFAIGMLQQRLGNTKDADEALTTSVRMHEAALKAVPTLRDVYLPRYQRALQAHAALKRQLGDTAAAEAIESRTSALPRPATVDLSRRISTAGDLRLLEPTTSPLAAEDVTQIRAVLAKAGLRAWMLTHSGPSERDGIPEWIVEVFLTPAIATTAQRGECAVVTRKGSSAWEVQKAHWFWMQIPMEGEDPTTAFPLKVQPAPNSPPPSTNEVVDLVKMVRANPEVKSWPIEIIVFWADGARFLLEEHATRARQSITLRRQGETWAVADIRTFPPQPR